MKFDLVREHKTYFEPRKILGISDLIFLFVSLLKFWFYQFILYANNLDLYLKDFHLHASCNRKEY